jgi:hypothetical protein
LIYIYIYIYIYILTEETRLQHLKRERLNIRGRENIIFLSFIL